MKIDMDENLLGLLAFVPTVYPLPYVFVAPEVVEEATTSNSTNYACLSLSRFVRFYFAFLLHLRVLRHFGHSI